MKNSRKISLLLGTIFPLLLSGCSLFPGGDGGSSKDSSTTEVEQITSFEIITDDILSYETSGDVSYYSMTLYPSDTYQIRTNIDDKLGNTYYFSYYLSKDEIPFTVSDKGLVTVRDVVDKTYISTFIVELYKKGQKKRVYEQYVSVTVKETEFANITLTNSDLTFDSDTKTYTLTLKSGSNYQIMTSITSNTRYTTSYSLKNSGDSSFINVNDKGLISTTALNEEKSSTIIIKTISTSGNRKLDEVKLNINLTKGDVTPTDELLVYDAISGNQINDGDKYDLHRFESYSFTVKYNKVNKTGVMSVSNSDVLTLDNDANKISGKAVGTSTVTFAYEESSITITIDVVKNDLVDISILGEGDGLLVINNNVLVLGEVKVRYESGFEKEITNHSLLTFKITDKDEFYKNVTVSYQEDNVEVSNTYSVKWYQVTDYKGATAKSYFDDLAKNYYTGEATQLPHSGNINLLVIPVWFNDSADFFNASQKEEMREDIDYILNATRGEKEYSSLKTYYEIESRDTLHLNSIVSDYYSSDTSYKNYSDLSNDNRTENSHILASDAIEWYFSTHTTDSISNYDNDNDGRVDGVIIYYTANYYGYSTDKMRSTAFESTNHTKPAYKYNNMAFIPTGSLYGVNARGIDVSKQKASTDLSKSFEYAFRVNSRVLIHEVGHMFGNKDLYETTLASERYSPAGSFSMQDNDVGSHDPYHLNLIGWNKPEVYDASKYEVGDEIQVKLSDLQSSGQNIILSRKWNDSLFDEYLIIELFTPTLLNAYEKEYGTMKYLTSGIRLWHINSILDDYNHIVDEGFAKTNTITEGGKYSLAYSNYDTESEYDLVHWIRNNEEENINTSSTLYNGDLLFQPGDEFSMVKYKSQFVNGEKLDNEEKLGWEFKVNEIYQNNDGSYDAILTLKRVDNTRTDFKEKVALNVDANKQPSAEITDYTKDVFGENERFSLLYRYVNAPSYYTQGTPISTKGMCLFASSDGDGGYIELNIFDSLDHEYIIKSVSITYDPLTKAKLTASSSGDVITGTKFEGEMIGEYAGIGYKYEVNAKSIILQNTYKDGLDYWSVISLHTLVIEYEMK